MKHTFAAIALVILLLVATGSALACQGKASLFQDDFTTMDPAWGPPTAQKWVKDGKFILQPELGTAFTVQNRASLFEDMDLCIKVRLAQGSDLEQGGGLVFWAQGLEDYYALLVAPSGDFMVRRRANGRWLYPVPRQEHAAIKRGLGQWNHLRIVTQGNQATLYINDTAVVTFKAQLPQKDNFLGLQAVSPEASPNVWEFAALRITSAEHGAVPKLPEVLAPKGPEGGAPPSLLGEGPRGQPAGMALTSTDGQSQLTVLPGWKPARDLNEQAELQAADRANQMYIIVLTESKQDLDDTDLQRFSEVTRGIFLERLTAPQVTALGKLTINGHPAVQYEIRVKVST
jgi:Domain of Unknown Function (DUF1080)